MSTINEECKLAGVSKATFSKVLNNKGWLGKEYRGSGLKSIVKVSSEIHEKSTGKDTTETRWYISSLDLNAENALHAPHSH